MQAYQGLDHIVLRLAQAERLHALLSGPLGLPVTWPLERAPFATFGWIGVGNTNLEIWAAASNSDLPADCPFPLVQGVALAPENLATSLAQLASNGIRCKAPRVFQSEDELGALQANFTNSVVLDVSSDACCVFFCEWSANAPIAPWPKGLAARERRTNALAQLSARSGGPLGLVGLSEITLTTRDLANATNKWQRLSGSVSEPIALTADVNLRLRKGSQDVIESLALSVRDLRAATAFLADRDLLEVSPAGEVLLCSKASAGLKFRFVEHTSAYPPALA